MHQHTFINLLVALSNLIVIPFIFTMTNKYDIMFMVLPATFSLLYHLGETKHYLYGIEPFNKYSWALLQFDRLMAAISGLYFLFHVQILDRTLIYCAFVGFTSLVISERIHYTPEWFAFFHIIWHLCAFYMMYHISLQR